MRKRTRRQTLADGGGTAATGGSANPWPKPSSVTPGLGLLPPSTSSPLLAEPKPKPTSGATLLPGAGEGLFATGGMARGPRKKESAPSGAGACAEATASKTKKIENASSRRGKGNTMMDEEREEAGLSARFTLGTPADREYNQSERFGETRLFK